MTDVFISHSSRDKSIAKEIRKNFEADGFSCWMAPDDVKGGRSYAGEIVEAINRSKVVLILLSNNSITSKHIPKEADLALTAKKPLLPVRTEDVLPTGSLEYILALEQRIDIFPGPVKKFKDRLSDTVSSLIQSPDVQILSEEIGKTFDETKTDSSQTQSKTKMIMAATIIVAFLITLGFVTWYKMSGYGQAEKRTTTFQDESKKLSVVKVMQVQTDSKTGMSFDVVLRNKEDTSILIKETTLRFNEDDIQTRGNDGNLRDVEGTFSIEITEGEESGRAVLTTPEGNEYKATAVAQGEKAIIVRAPIVEEIPANSSKTIRIVLAWSENSIPQSNLKFLRFLFEVDNQETIESEKIKL